MNKNIKHYKANKRTYYLNLRSFDALATPKPDDIQKVIKYEWNVKDLNLSSQARICVSSMYFQNTDPNDDLPIVIRCPQVQNLNVFDSANGISTIICISNMLHTPTIENWFPLNSQNLNRIELYMSDSIINTNAGVSITFDFYIQFKIEDYSTEEIDSKLMPTYTRDSLSYVYPLNV